MRVATPANEVLLLDHARLMTASQLEKLSRKYALVERHGQDPHPVGDEQRRYVRRRDTDDGMVKIETVLHPEEAELVWTMLNHAATQLAREPDVCSHDDSAESHVAPSVPGTTALSLSGHIESHRVDDSAESYATLSASATTTMAKHIDPRWPRWIGDSAESRNVTSSLATITAVSPVPIETLGSDDSAESRDVIESTSRRDVLAPGWCGAPAPRSIDGVRSNRSPIEITLTMAGSSLRAGVADPLEVGEIGESFIATQAARRLSCDAGVVEVIETEDGVPLSVGRKRRTIAGALKRALHKRDGACVYPGCTHRIFLEGHHIKHWADGGETSLKNTALLGSSQHRYVNEYGYTIEFGPDQRPCFRNPYGQLVAAVPARPVLTDPGWPRIRAVNEPLAIDAGTIACEWDGKPVDYGAIAGHLVAADGIG
jgi:hypothetical protein